MVGGAITWIMTKPVSITVEFVDQLKTPLFPNQTYTRTLLRGYSITPPERTGYRLAAASKSKLQGRFSIQHRNIVLQYEPVGGATPLSQVNHAKYVGATFEVMNSKPDRDWQADPKQWNGGIDRLRIITSNDGIKWHTVNTNYPNLTVRDPSIIKYKDVWYICYTNGLLKTSDFQHWQQINWPLKKDTYSHQWAPEFFKDNDNKYHIVMSNELKTSQYDTAFQSYISDFNPETGSIKSDWHRVTGPDLPDNMIDSHIDYHDGQYYLWFKDENRKELKLATSNNYQSGYKIKETKIQPNNVLSYEGQFTLPRADNEVRLYIDVYIKETAMYKGVHYIDSSNNLQTWSDLKPIQADFLVRHFSIWQNIN